MVVERLARLWTLGKLHLAIGLGITGQRDLILKLFALFAELWSS
jgi:hypothetical protein